MMRSSFAAAGVLALLLGCGADTATKEPESPAPEAPVDTTPAPDLDEPGVVITPETEADRAIRRELGRALAEDPHLKDRSISFLVTNGDVSVSGTVKNEQERRRINDLAMDIEGVKSVANALRVDD